MGRGIAVLLTMGEQRDPGCIITVSSPGPGEDTTCTDSNPTRSLLSRLKAPTQSDLCRKRSVASNSLCGKCMKRSSGSSYASDPGSVSPQQRAKEFSLEFIGVSGGKLFCTACREELSLKRAIFKSM